MSLSWKSIGKWIPISFINCGSQYIRKCQDKLSNHYIIPMTIIQLIILEAYFFEIFEPMKSSYFEASQNQQQQYLILSELERILQIKSKWDPTTILLFNDIEFTGSLFAKINNLTGTILCILSIIQRHTTKPLFLRYRADKVLLDVLMKYQDNQHAISLKSQGNLLYLLSNIIPENEISRMYLYQEGLYEYLVKKTDYILKLVEIDDRSIDYLR